MSDGTPIEWSDATWNPITGCDIKSPGCIHCYAMTLAGTRLRNHPSRTGLTKRAANGAHVWTGETRLNAQWLDQPVRWKRPRMIFVVAHGDLFYEEVPEAWIDDVFAIMALADWHKYQLLTKRADRMAAYMKELYAGRMHEVAEKWRDAGNGALEKIRASFVRGLPQCWLGVSAEDQRYFDERVEYLREIPAAVRWVSAEPLLSVIDMSAALPALQWVVCGGESGRGARPMHPAWARQIRDQCVAAGTPFLFKQWGAYLPTDQVESRRFSCEEESSHDWGDGIDSIHLHKKQAGRVLDGKTWDELPRALT